jgi:hypothetical protein
MLSLFIVPLVKACSIKATGYCYHSVNVIILVWHKGITLSSFYCTTICTFAKSGHWKTQEEDMEAKSSSTPGDLTEIGWIIKSKEKLHR